jgi:hypothetical protein
MTLHDKLLRQGVKNIWQLLSAMATKTAVDKSMATSEDEYQFGF